MKHIIAFISVYMALWFLAVVIVYWKTESDALAVVVCLSFQLGLTIIFNDKKP